MSLEQGPFDSLVIPHDSALPCLASCGFPQGVYSGYCSICWQQKTAKQKIECNEVALRTLAQRQQRVDHRKRLYDAVALDGVLHDNLLRISAGCRETEMTFNMARKRAHGQFRGADDEAALNASIDDSCDIAMKQINALLDELNECAAQYDGVRVPFCVSPVWTLLSCLGRVGIPADIRRIIYYAVVQNQYGKGCQTRLAPLQRVLDGRSWSARWPAVTSRDKLKELTWYSKLTPVLPCIAPACQAVARPETGAALGKLLYEKWLSEHFLNCHAAVSWETYGSKSYRCSHANTTVKTTYEYVVVDTLRVNTDICTDCGAILSIQKDL